MAMITRKMALWCIVGVLAILPFVTLYFKATREVTPLSHVIDAEELVELQQGRVSERIEFLDKQSLDETFAYLLDTQQYLATGNIGSGSFVKDIDRLLSSRGFLKAFQQFGELSQEQVKEKLHEFSEKAIEAFGKALEIALWRNANPTLESPDKPISLVAAKYMVCTTMLLAASMGESDLLLNQIAEMQFLIDAYVEGMRAYIPLGPALSKSVWSDISRRIASLDDDTVLTVLMYAVKCANIDLNADISRDVFVKQTIPLFRWDAEAIYHDFLPQMGLQEIDPQNATEQFVVYEFPSDHVFDDQKRKQILTTLKEHLSK